MARREVVDCDSCGAKNAASAQDVRVRVGSEYNGVETVGDYESVDLCPACLGQQLRVLLEKAGEAFCREWVRAIRRKEPPAELLRRAWVPSEPPPRGVGTIGVPVQPVSVEWDTKQSE